MDYNSKREDYVDSNGVVYSADMQCLRRVPRDFEGELEVSRRTTEIGIWAFKGCNRITSVSLSNSLLKTIRERAFEDCKSLKFCNIPTTVGSIGRYAFAGCTSMANIGLPASLKSIGEGAFKDCVSLESIVVPSLIETIENRTFEGCKNLLFVDLPYNLKSIGDYAFKDCESMEMINLDRQVGNVGNGIFDGCSSLKVVYSTNVKRIRALLPENVPYDIKSLSAFLIEWREILSDEHLRSIAGLKEL